MPPSRSLERVAEALAQWRAPFHVQALGERSSTGPPRRLRMSPLRKTAPSARPVRRKGDSCRQVSWLAGRHPRSAFPGSVAQWRCGEGLAANSCGGSSGLSPDQGRTEFPLGRLQVGTPAPLSVKSGASRLSTPLAVARVVREYSGRSIHLRKIWIFTRAFAAAVFPARDGALNPAGCGSCVTARLGWLAGRLFCQVTRAQSIGCHCTGTNSYPLLSLAI
jgi:hypothetical protein